MQLCTVYRSAKKADTYLYVEKNNDFSKVPEQLRTLLGNLTLVMTFNLDGRKSLGGADLSKVKSELNDKGFYLQLPPPEENLLDEHKKQIGHQD
ncbi:MAG: YcgL domain-containing protein [Gammaproteobacteria bacterium]|nr:YcgL domain-containing protein [Gammaproteobacteria bacterium]